MLAVLWPLGRKAANLPAGGNDLLVYQDQLEEIGRDRNAGLIGSAEAEAARVEVSRRLLAAADTRVGPEIATQGSAQRMRHRRMAAILGLIAILVLPLGLYLDLGSPNVPGQPAFARSNPSPNGQSIESLVSQVEAHLAKNPNDGAGWEVIAPVYLRLGRYDDAVAAWRRATALNGENATRDSGLGEALVGTANGVVTDEAKAGFQSSNCARSQGSEGALFPRPRRRAGRQSRGCCGTLAGYVGRCAGRCAMDRICPRCAGPCYRRAGAACRRSKRCRRRCRERHVGRAAER